MQLTPKAQAWDQAKIELVPITPMKPLSPNVIILTEEDFQFLEDCGISTKGMLLGDWQ